MRDKGTARRELVPRQRGIYCRLDSRGKRIPGVFEITYYDSDRKRRWETVYGDVEDAEAERAKKAKLKRAGYRVAPSKKTLDEYVPEWIESQAGRLRPKTLTTYEGHLRLHVQPKIGKLMLPQITTDHIASLIVDMQRAGYKPWTIKGTLSSLSALMRHAARRGLVAENPVTRLERDERPTTTEKEKRILTGDEITRLLDAADDKYRALLATGLGTGLRLGELVGLRWQDVDANGGGFIHVRTQVDQKGRRAEPKTPTAVRSVVLSPQLGRLLAAHKLASNYSAPTDPVFTSVKGTPLGHDNVRERGLEAALTRANLDDTDRPKITMHSLRDTFASHLIVDLGLDVVQVSRQLGHANPAITAKTYARMFDEARHADAIRDAMESSSFGAAMEPKMEPRPSTEPPAAASEPGGESENIVHLEGFRT
jgi:integrase